MVYGLVDKIENEIDRLFKVLLLNLQKLRVFNFTLIYKLIRGRFSKPPAGKIYLGLISKTILIFGLIKFRNHFHNRKPD